MALDSKEVTSLIVELTKVVAKVIRWKRLPAEEREAVAGLLIEIGGKLAADLVD